VPIQDRRHLFKHPLRSGWRSGVAESPVEEVNAPALLCMIFEAFCGWFNGEIEYCHATIADAVSIAKELNDAHALAVGLLFTAMLAQLERNPARTESFAAELIEVSTHHNFKAWLAWGSLLRGWARSASGNPVEGVSWIDTAIRDCRTTGSTLGIPYCLAIKAEALHLADRTSEALEAIGEAEALIERTEDRALPNCTGSAVCFSRQWVPITSKLKLRFTKRFALQNTRSRSHWQHARKHPTRNTASKKRAGCEDVDSDYLLVNAKKRPGDWHNVTHF
jgi:hypothetical protein